jgi:hypothetical protein
MYHQKYAGQKIAAHDHAVDYDLFDMKRIHADKTRSMVAHRVRKALGELLFKIQGLLYDVQKQTHVHVFGRSLKESRQVLARAYAKLLAHASLHVPRWREYQRVCRRVAAQPLADPDVPPLHAVERRWLSHTISSRKTMS